MQSLFSHLSPRSADPSAPLFRRIRWELTGWYSGILAITLLVIGVVLYIGERAVLLGPVDNNLQATGQQAALLSGQFFRPCAAGATVAHGAGLFWLCYDQNGQLLDVDQEAQDIPHLADQTLVRQALRAGSAWDTVETHSFAGAVRLYAARISAPDGSTQGVFEVGTVVGGELRALETLVALLLVTGLLALIAAALTGFLLAARSLRPARLAYLRQRDFIADASHELRTPLTLVRADAEVLLRDRGSLTADQVAILEDVVQEVAHMGALADNMLDLARLDAGRLHLEQDVVDLAALAREMGRRAGRLAAERQVTLRVEASGPVLVVGDTLLLEHVALILVDNALKYNRPGGEVVLSAARDDDHAVLTVRDTGIGIAAEHLPHLGERFYRVDKARSREAGGAGLGVSIAQAIAARHGGSLRYDSEPGQGTTVRLVLTAASGNAAAVAATYNGAGAEGDGNGDGASPVSGDVRRAGSL